MSKADQFLGYATAELGHPYVFGAENSGPRGAFDCSGLTQFTLAKVGIKAPRTAHEQQAWARPVSSPLPGDLVFYGFPAHHVGIYLGAGKMIDAPHSGAVVRIEGVGHPTGYGRVPGLGAAASAVGAPVAAAAQTVAGLFDVGALFSGVKQITYETVFAGLALGLIGFGLYRLTVAPAKNRLLSNMNLGG